MSVEHIDLTDFKRAAAWRRENASTVFATYGSWTWFKRLYRARLVAAGALIVRRGRAGDLVHVGRIGAVVAEILAEQSAALVEGVT